ncbi:MAG: hypothetical protein NVS3B20_17040 [Polyangiales bacterium]
MSEKKCGSHVELAANKAARITRCACGTLHVHLHAQGLSLRLDESSLRHVANAMSGALRLVDMADAAAQRPTDETIN